MQEKVNKLKADFGEKTEEEGAKKKGLKKKAK